MRGLRRVEEDQNPDYLFAHQLTLKREMDAQTYYDYGYVYAGAYRRVVVDVPYTAVRTYVKGTLILDMLDPTEHHLVWRVWAEAEVDPNRREPDDVNARVDEAAAKMMEKFPIQPPETQ